MRCSPTSAKVKLPETGGIVGLGLLRTPWKLDQAGLILDSVTPGPWFLQAVNEWFPPGSGKCPSEFMGKEVFNTALTMVGKIKIDELLPTMFPGWNTKAFLLRTVLFFP